MVEVLRQVRTKSKHTESLQQAHLQGWCQYHDVSYAVSLLPARKIKRDAAKEPKKKAEEKEQCYCWLCFTTFNVVIAAGVGYYGPHQRSCGFPHNNTATSHAICNTLLQ